MRVFCPERRCSDGLFSFARDGTAGTRHLSEQFVRVSNIDIGNVHKSDPLRH